MKALARLCYSDIFNKKNRIMGKNTRKDLRECYYYFYR
jgi:hypothetical protein